MNQQSDNQNQPYSPGGAGQPGGPQPPPQAGGPYGPPQGGPGYPVDHGRRISGIVRDSLQSGDLSQLSKLGPAVADVVNSSISAVGNTISGVKIETRNTGVPAQHQQPGAKGPAQPGYQRPGWFPQDGGQHQNYQRPQWFPQGGKSRVQHVAPGVFKIDTAGLNKPKIPKGIVRMVFGILGAVVFGLSIVTFAILSGVFAGVDVFEILAGVSCFGFAGSMLLANAGVRTNRLAKRAEKIYALFDSKKVISIEDIAAYTGSTPKKVQKDVTKMHKRGWLLDLFYDKEHTCLMKGEDSYEQYLESIDHTRQLQREEQQRQERLQNPETADLETFRREGVETIRKIRAANDAIPGEEISDKLSRLEESCARIFEYVAQHPDNLPDTRKFMDYYLPTTLKLVEKYREYEKMEYQPENVLEAKHQIESALGTIEGAYRNLLASFYQPDTLDVSTDIVVLQNMLEQEGLTGKKFDIGKPGVAPAAPVPAPVDSTPPPVPGGSGEINLKLGE